MKTLLLLFCLALGLLELPAQNAKIDSLKRVIETTKADTVKARALCRLCIERIEAEGPTGAALQHAGQGLALAQQALHPRTTALCLIAAAQYHIMADKNEAARGELKQALVVSDAAGLKDMAASAYNLLGHTCLQSSEYPQALQYYQQALRLRESMGDSNGIALSWSRLGLLYFALQDTSNAFKYYQRSLNLYRRMGNKAEAAHTLTNIGASYHMPRKSYAEAVKCFQEALGLNQEIDNPQGMLDCLLMLAGACARMEDHAQADEYCGKALSLAESSRIPEVIQDTYRRAGAVYEGLGRYPEALRMYKKAAKVPASSGYGWMDSGNQALINCSISEIYLKMGQPAEARSYALNGRKAASRTGSLEMRVYGAQVLYQADSALGDWKNAFAAHRIYKMYSDSLRNDEKSKELGRVESQVEYEKQAEIDRLKAEEEKLRERERYAWMLGSAGGGLLLLAVIAFTLFRGRRKEKKANAALRALNEEIQQRKAEIEAQNVEINSINSELQTTLDRVNAQKAEIEEQHAKIEDSIRYASRIQHAILPSETQLSDGLPAHFIHYQPRDIVSGDFYWMTKHGGTTFFAAVDCTGHGVPGAFMSVLGSNLLHQIVDENQITEPDVILAELDRRISATLRQQFGGDSKDGMDVALVVLHEADENGTRTVDFAGAGRPLWHCHGGEITEYKSAKYSCGGSQHEAKQYPASRIEARTDDRLYLFSDGPVDQFGGPQGRKLGSVQLRAFLLETASLPVEKQGEAFAAFFNGWMGARKQLDDVLVAGISA